jgi:uncharacterized protein YjiS (DUF1127 family)
MSFHFAAPRSASRALRAVSRWISARRDAALLSQMSGRDLADIGLSHAPEADALGLVGCERARRQAR